MATNKSLDESKIIAALLHDVHTSLGLVFNYKSLLNTTRVVEKRLSSSEGIGFLTKTLPRLGKAFEKALSADTPLNATKLRFAAQRGSKLPRFLGELFNQVLDQDGQLLPEPCAKSVGHLRQIFGLFYKYELPYTAEQEMRVISKFVRTENELTNVDATLSQDRVNVTTADPHRRWHQPGTILDRGHVVRKARAILSDLFSLFDPTDIYPRHGPGAVSTKEQLWEKYHWTNVPGRLTDLYPFDAYFCASVGHVCDSYRDYSLLTEREIPAKVCLVPKDSRGPRLISCESLPMQWIQQGLGRAIVKHVESNVLTKYNVFFTNQQPNGIGALWGSKTGGLATLDLNEASDRVSLELVRLLFPEHLCRYLEGCRSLATELPDGTVLPLKKFAPMGSCLCFPIMALSIWAILTAAAPDKDIRESILVYGDDVIVPTAFAVNAMEQLESFGLKINRDKSCIKGFFRESCGCDAFKGVNVTPVRLRTVWSSSRSPDSYVSWIAYANSFYSKGYRAVYDYIVELLVAVYGPIPAKGPDEPVNGLLYVDNTMDALRSRWNKRLQRREYLRWTVRSSKVINPTDGWEMLLRYFAEAANGRNDENAVDRKINEATAHALISSRTEGLVPTHGFPDIDPEIPFWSDTYTRRDASILARRWR